MNTEVNGVDTEVVSDVTRLVGHATKVKTEGGMSEWTGQKRSQDKPTIRWFNGIRIVTGIP